jgi:hypothetical protein
LGERGHRFSSGERGHRRSEGNGKIGFGGVTSRRRFARATNTACPVSCIQRNSIFLVNVFVE